MLMLSKHKIEMNLSNRLSSSNTLGESIFDGFCYFQGNKSI